MTPEAPYPKIGGGALRAASIYEYLLRRHHVDVITFREDSRAVTLPGARDVLILDLPYHPKSTLARVRRNLRRGVSGRPPLIDRYSGFDGRVADWLSRRHYEFAVVEHFWCAPYANVLRPHVKRLVLDLHNIESALQTTMAAAVSWPLSLLLRRFGEGYSRLEDKWLPHYDDVLVASGEDARRVAAGRVTVYPNTIPRMEQPSLAREHAIVFTGNLEYEPNVSAVRWFAREVWPLVRKRDAELEWRLIGGNAHAIEGYTRRLDGLKIVGRVPDAAGQIARAKAAVVPLLAGSGTRFKILEAWATATPVVSTTIGAEGLGAVHERHLLIADHPADFAEAVLRVVRSPGELGPNGRELYLARFTNESGWRVLEDLGL